MAGTRVIVALCFAFRCVFGGVMDMQAVTTEATVEDVFKKLDIMDKGMRELIDNAIKMAMPMVVRSSSEIEISPECQGSFVKMIIDLKQIKEWPVKMLDASEKLPSGILLASFGEWGQYDECLDVASYDEYSKKLLLQGQYCLLELRPPLPPKPKDLHVLNQLEAFDNYTTDNFILKTLIRRSNLAYGGAAIFAVCVPSTCSKKDIQNVATYIAAQAQIYASVVNCEIKKPLEIDSLQYALIGIFAAIVLLCFIGTAVDVLQNRMQKTPNKNQQISTFGKIVKSFSVKTNVDALVNVGTCINSDLRCIHGIRVFTIQWVILAHTYVITALFRHKNTLVVGDWFHNVAFEIVMNGTLSMETFFCIGGMVSSYTAVSSYNKNSFNRSIPSIMVRRIWRLLPGMLLVMAVAIVMPITGSGPYWNMITGFFGNNCRKRWFYNLLFINNLLEPKDTCVGHLWYVAIDTQYYVIALVALVLFFKKSMWGIGLCITMILVSIITVPIVVYQNELDPSITAKIASYHDFQQYNKYIFWKPYSHMSSYFVGFITAILIAKRRNVKLNLVWQIIGWTLSTAVAFAILLGPYEWVRGRKATLLETIFYSGLHMPLWALVISWIVFACVNGYGGFVNSVLSFKGFIPLSRLTFLVYLLHLLVLIYYFTSLREGLFYGHITLVWIFLGTSFATYLVAFVAHVIYDGPLNNLGRIIIAKLMPSSQQRTSSLVHKGITSFGHSDKNDAENNDNGQINAVYVKKL